MPEKTCAQQKEFFHTGRTRPYEFRIAQLRKLGKAVESAEKDIYNALYTDLKRPPSEVYTSENAFIMAEIRYAMKHLHRWMKSQKVKTPLLGFPGKSYVYPEPYGICGIFSPWNYPFQLSLVPLVGSITAGNCAILKPSEIGPASSVVIERIINENFDPSYIKCITGGKEIANELLQAPLDCIFFTGSTRVGSIVMQEAGRRLIPVVLELGGKSPCIITTDVPLEVTVRRILWGKFINAGQTCIAPDYLLVPRAMSDEFLEVSRKVLLEFYGPDPGKSPDYSRMINQNHMERLINLAEHSTCVIGGEFNRDELYISPSIYYPVDWNEPIMQEEIFGPLLPVIPYDSLEQVIKTLQTKEHPLALYLFSRSNNTIQQVIKAVKAGGFCVNDTLVQVASTHLPFGGVGSSGLGKYHGYASFKELSHYKSVMKRGFRPDFAFRYPPNNISLPILKRLTRFLF